MDRYTEIAADAFNKPATSVAPEERRLAKDLVFGSDYEAKPRLSRPVKPVVIFDESNRVDFTRIDFTGFETKLAARFLETEAMLYLRIDPDPILRRRCRSDLSISFRDLDEMFALMRDADGLGLAAPQVGIDGRLFVTTWGEVFINPRIVAVLEPYISTEGCLSLPGRIVRIQRYKIIRLADGRTFEGEQAQVIQHECDHLSGILITDLEVQA